MNHLHGLDSINIKIKGISKVKCVDKWDEEECFKEGLEMIIE
ncbi:hypothetical protein [Clostridium botulinum]|nr:hypothetical protein [Clostridium botulinum]